MSNDEITSPDYVGSANRFFDQFEKEIRESAEGNKMNERRDLFIKVALAEVTKGYLKLELEKREEIITRYDGVKQKVDRYIALGIMQEKQYLEIATTVDAIIKGADRFQKEGEQDE